MQGASRDEVREGEMLLPVYKTRGLVLKHLNYFNDVQRVGGVTLRDPVMRDKRRQI
jgi:hypothetical protein